MCNVRVENPDGRRSSGSAANNLLSWAGFGLLVVGIAVGSLTFFDGLFGVRGTYFLVLGGILSFIGYFRLRRVSLSDPDPRAGLIIVAILLCSDVVWRPTAAMQAVELTTFFKIMVLFCGGLCAFLPRASLMVLAIACVTIAAIGFYATADGQKLFADDHPAFMYRIHQLVEHFPSIPFYNTEWNGGVEAREFFPSGVLNFFAIWWPFFYFLGVQESYTIAVASTLFLLAPLSMALAARLSGLNCVGCLVATILALLPTLLWYRWGLKYGTIGFTVSSILLPLNVVLVSRFIDFRRTFSLPRALVSAISITLMALWSLSNVAFIPAYVALILKPISILRSKSRVFLLILLLFLNLPWMVMFVKFSPVAKFVSADTEQAQQLQISERENEQREQSSVTTKVAKGLTPLRGFVGTLNVLLIVGVFGLGLFPTRFVGALLSVQIIWLLVLGTVADRFLPHLELDRMLVMAALVLIIPAASFVQRSVEYAQRSFFTRIGVGVCAIGPLFFTPFGIDRVVRNRSLEQYAFEKPIVGMLVKAIEQHAPEGRVMIAGFILHELSGGHVAPLPWLSRRPMIASSYQHDRWEHQDVVPESFRKRGEEGILEFLSLYDVTAIVTHERGWRSWYSARPKHFELVWRGERFSLFKRLNYESTLIFSGEGEINHVSANALLVTPHSDTLVIKFNFANFLTSSGCILEATSVADGVKLVKLSKCTIGSTVEIRSESPIRRIF